jgi:hypothetical protein
MVCNCRCRAPRQPPTDGKKEHAQRTSLRPAETNYNLVNIRSHLSMELKTARLTILIDPAKKLAFEELCRTQDMTPSQVVRRLIRDYMDDQQAEATRRPAARKTAPRGRR